MKYLVIENQGEIAPEAFLLMGACTKRGQAGFIGLFGSGAKFALACLMREATQLLILSGEKRYTFGTKAVSFREQEFWQITVREGRHSPVETQYTTTMGLDWEVDGALRELISNCYDEPSPNIFLAGEVMPRPGYTRVYVQYTEKVRAAYEDFDGNFTFRRKALAEGDGWAIYRPYGTGARIYRRGVQVFHKEDVAGCFDYRADSLDVREDRKSDRYSCEVEVARILGKLDVERLGEVLDFLVTAEGETFEGDNRCLSWYSEGMREHIQTLVNGRVMVTAGEFRMFGAELAEHSILIMPAKWIEVFGKMSGMRVLKDVISPSKLLGFTLVDSKSLTPREQATMSLAQQFVMRAGIKINQYERKVFSSEKDDAALGQALIATGTILLNRKLLTRSVREVVEVLLEEFVHLDTKNSDFTRGFQNGLIRNWVNTLLHCAPDAAAMLEEAQVDQWAKTLAPLIGYLAGKEEAAKTGESGGAALE